MGFDTLRKCQPGALHPVHGINHAEANRSTIFANPFAACHSVFLRFRFIHRGAADRPSSAAVDTGETLN
jgi:hypothetical protein